MLECFSTETESRAVAVIPLRPQDLADWLETQPAATRRWIEASEFRARPGSVRLVPAADGGLGAVLVGIDSGDDVWTLAALPGQLPDGVYRVEAPTGQWSSDRLTRAALGWGLGAYRFERYSAHDGARPRLLLSSDMDAAELERLVRAVFDVRDLINTPAGDMMPEDLAGATEVLAQHFGAEFRQVVGDALLEENYPVVHAVGRASAHPPRLLDLVWGSSDHPKLTLVGKGVCFDSGGLDLKPAAGMRLMKKDMGGAAHVLGLARLVMDAGLAVRLRVLIPAVENAVAGNALRPGDVLTSRQGLTVEIDNTDAEGRLVLGDALAAAAEEAPALIVDFATLTGAARVAVGTEMASFFAGSEALATGLAGAAERVRDPIWRLPLHRPYRDLLDSDIADIANASAEPYAGAITAALFLQEFVPAEIDYAHFDLMGWNLRARPGRPKGGEAMGMRAVYAYLCQRFS